MSTKLSALPPNGSPALTDTVISVEGSGPTDVQVTITNLLKLLFGTNTILSSQVTSYVNGGTATGTFYYGNIGGIKFVIGSGNTATLSGSAPQSATTTVTLPVSFFTTIWAPVVSFANPSATDYLACLIDSYNTTTVTVRINSTSGSGGSGQFGLFVFGV